MKFSDLRSRMLPISYQQRSGTQFVSRPMAKRSRSHAEESEPDLLAFESLEDMADSSCTGRHSRKSKSALRVSGGSLRGADSEASHRCKDPQTYSIACGMSHGKHDACESTLLESFVSRPIHFQPPAASKRAPNLCAEGSKLRHSTQKQESTLKGAVVDHVRVSKDPAHEAEFSNICDALAAVADRGHLVEVAVYPGNYEEPSLLLESNVRLVGLSSTSHLSSVPACADKSKPVIICVGTGPAVVSSGTGSLIRNFHFRDANSCNRRPQGHSAVREQAPLPADRRGKRPLQAVTERMETRLSFDWSTPPDCQRLPKAKRRVRGNFEDVVSELAAVKSEMEALRTHIRDEARAWRSDPAIWGSTGVSMVQEAFAAARVDAAAGQRGTRSCMIDVVAGKVEIEDCVWDGRPGVDVSHADAAVRGCHGSGPRLSQYASLRVKGCGNLNFC